MQGASWFALSLSLSALSCTSGDCSHLLFLSSPSPSCPVRLPRQRGGVEPVHFPQRRVLQVGVTCCLVGLGRPPPLHRRIGLRDRTAARGGAASTVARKKTDANLLRRGPLKWWWPKRAWNVALAACCCGGGGHNNNSKPPP